MLLARFGLVAGPPPTIVAKVLRTEKARALFMGVAAHAFQPLTQPLVTGIGAGIIAAGHAVGWPVIRGGTGRFTDASIAMLKAMGVRFETGQRITRLHELPRHDIVMLDVHPHIAAGILAAHQPRRSAGDLWHTRRWRDMGASRQRLPGEPGLVDGEAAGDDRRQSG